MQESPSTVVRSVEERRRTGMTLYSGSAPSVQAIMNIARIICTRTFTRLTKLNRNIYTRYAGSSVWRDFFSRNCHIKYTNKTFFGLILTINFPYNIL